LRQKLFDKLWSFLRLSEFAYRSELDEEIRKIDEEWMGHLTALSEEYKALKQRLDEVERAYLNDPRREKEKQEEKDAPTPGFVPFSARKRQFEIRHSGPKKV
jgi:hypothetical protein